MHMHICVCEYINIFYLTVLQHDIESVCVEKVKNMDNKKSEIKLY